MTDKSEILKSFAPAKKVGSEYSTKLLLENQWVKRINEKMIIKSDSLATLRKITIDCFIDSNFMTYEDFKHKLKEIDNLSIEDSVKEQEDSVKVLKDYKNESQIIVPLGVLTKEPIDNLDVVLDGKSIPVLKSSENGELTKWMLKSFYLDTLSRYIQDPFVIEELTVGIYFFIDKIVSYDGISRGGKSSNQEKILDFENLTEWVECFKENATSVPSTAKDDLNCWCDNLDSFIDLLDLFEDNFILFCLVPSSCINQWIIIKCQISLPNRDNLLFNSRMHYFNFDGGFNFEYRIPLFWHNSSYHFYVEFPDDLVINRFSYEINEKISHPKNKSRYNKIFENSVNVLIPPIHEEFFPPEFETQIHVIPSNIGIRLYTYWAAIILLLCFLSSIFIRAGGILGEGQATPSLIGLITASITLMLAFSLNSPEHYLKREILRPVRFCNILICVSLALFSILISVRFLPLVENQLWIIFNILTCITFSLRIRLESSYNEGGKLL